MPEGQGRGRRRPRAQGKESAYLFGGRKRGEEDGTSGDDESVYHHADQYVDRVRGLDRPEYHDSFDPSR